MTPKEATKLAIGDRVKWMDGATGTVTEKNWHAAKIEWDDGHVGVFQFKNNEPQWTALSKAETR
jgi:hypothetical protein